MFDKKVRALRLLEETVELCQAVEVPRDQVARCISVVYARSPGRPEQELGGVLVCAHAFAAARAWDVDEILQREVHRCLSKSPDEFKKRNEEKLNLGLTG